MTTTTYFGNEFYFKSDINTVLTAAQGKTLALGNNVILNEQTPDRTYFHFRDTGIVSQFTSPAFNQSVLVPFDTITQDTYSTGFTITNKNTFTYTGAPKRARIELYTSISTTHPTNITIIQLNITKNGNIIGSETNSLKGDDYLIFNVLSATQLIEGDVIQFYVKKLSTGASDNLLLSESQVLIY